MKFATTAQIFTLTLAWAGALFGLDYVKNPHLWNKSIPPPSAVGAEGVHVHIWINHLCCSGCLGEVTAALASVPWLGKPAAERGVMQQATADQVSQSNGLPEYGGYLDVPVLDVGQLDFMTIDRLIRDKGLVPGRMELSGVSHYRLEASVPHICCGMCRAGVEEGFAIAKKLAYRGDFKWLDSVTVNKERKLVVAHARYLEPKKTVDVGEFIAGLNTIGFAPAYVHVLVGEENQTASR